tara:strand:+ start:1361 stop:1873 length:513 start_codon:yes stop_codon:yes gene_type:complete
MKKISFALILGGLLLSSCSVIVPVRLAKPARSGKAPSSGLVKKIMETPAYAGLDPDQLKTRDDVNKTFVNDDSVSFKTENHGDTWVYDWRSDESRTSDDSSTLEPKILRFNFEGDSVVSWESEGINLYAFTWRQKIITGCAVGLGLDLVIVAAALSDLNLFPGGITLAPI